MENLLDKIQFSDKEDHLKNESKLNIFNLDLIKFAINIINYISICHTKRDIFCVIFKFL